MQAGEIKARKGTNIHDEGRHKVVELGTAWCFALTTLWLFTPCAGLRVRMGVATGDVPAQTTIAASAVMELAKGNRRSTRGAASGKLFP